MNGGSMETIEDARKYGVTLERFIEWRTPRFGKANPEKIESAVWEWLFHSKLSGYGSTSIFQNDDLVDDGPTLSFERFGQTVTLLPDGRKVYIAGEHEDYYHPDFYIYNDIVVEYPDGQLVFYCYPEAVFSATDFHTATLVGNQIILIGSLGYIGKRRIGDTQVYSLNIDTFRIDKIHYSGEAPGWIHNHSAELDVDQKNIRVTGGTIEVKPDFPLKENIDIWQINISTWTWERLSNRAWVNWQFLRKDNGYVDFSMIRQALWYRESNWCEEYQNKIMWLEKILGHSVNVDLIAELYQFDFSHGELVADENEENYGKFWLTIDGVDVSFYEGFGFLQVIVEGEIEISKLALIKQQLLFKLNKMIKTDWILIEY